MGNAHVTVPLGITLPCRWVFSSERGDAREIKVSWAESIDDISVEGAEIVAFNAKEKILTINAGTFVQYKEVWVKNRQNTK